MLYGLNFILYINKLLSLFGLMPFFNFNHENIKYVKEYKVYCTITASVGLIYWFYGFWARFINAYMYLTALHIILIVLWEIIDNLMQFYSILATAHSNMDKWKQLLKNFSLVESFLKINRERKYNSLKLAIFFFIQVIWICFLVGNFMEFHQGSYTLGSLRHFAIMYLYHYFVILLFVLINGIAMNIHFNLKKLRRSFQNTCDKQLQCKNKQFSRQVRNLGRIFRKCNETIEIFNELFGWQILASIIISSLNLLICLNFISLYFYDINVHVIKLSPKLLFFDTVLHVSLCVSRI